jgi:putative glutamine amidotransferase
MLKVLVPLARRGEVTDLFIDYGLRSTYLHKLTAYGLAPVLVSPETPVDMVTEFYRESRAILLMGGTDIDPKNYYAARHPLTESADRPRDELELMITRMALEDKKPVLGICRGCQLLNVAAGGTLIQHIEEGVVRHRLLREDPTYDGLLRQSRHDVNLKEGSKIRALLNVSTISTNSAHHQCVETLGKNLIATGFAADGIIEVIEHSDPSYFCFAVQCHPEADSEGPLEPLFRAFAEVVRQG